MFKEQSFALTIQDLGGEQEKKKQFDIMHHHIFP